MSELLINVMGWMLSVLVAMAVVFCILGAIQVAIIIQRELEDLNIRLPKLWERERLVTVQQFRDLNRKPHLFIITNKRIVELDYKDMNKRTTVATLKQIKAAKPQKGQK